jgi:hypothetical protein
MRFRYLNDPLFVSAVMMYAGNRFILRLSSTTPFLHEHLNDLLCIPFWLPIMLFMQRRARLRGSDDPPSSLEIMIPLVIWGWMFEVWLPSTQIFGRWVTADPEDIFWYTAGALAASAFWRFWYRRAERPAVPPTVG